MSADLTDKDWLEASDALDMLLTQMETPERRPRVVIIASIEMSGVPQVSIVGTAQPVELLSLLDSIAEVIKLGEEVQNNEGKPLH